MSIKIGFSDFWPGFHPETDSIFGNLFQENFDIEYDNNNPDLLFFSAYNTNFKKYDCQKILFTPENFFSWQYAALDNVLGPDNVFKYATHSITSFDLNDERNFRMPCYIRRHQAGYGIKDIIQNRIPVDIKDKTRKVLFLHNTSRPVRNNFITELGKYLPVDSPGQCLRNVNIKVEDKIEFSKQYKFVMAFENSSAINYNTEKITDPYESMCIPLYWGDSNIENDFDKDSMINLHNFDSTKDMIDKIMEIDNNDELYLEMLSKPPIINNDLFNEKRFIKFIKGILDEK